MKRNARQKVAAEYHGTQTITPRAESHMPAAYSQLLQKMRLAFPQPVSDRVHDSYLVHSIMRALDLVDELKSDLPVLSAAPLPETGSRSANLAPQSSSVEAVTSDLVRYLEGMPIFGHPRIQENVIGQPSIPSLIGVLLASLYNPNLAEEEYSRRLALAEVEARKITAALIGYDPELAGGVFTFGGTGTMLYGAKIGLEKACPGAMANGAPDDQAVILTSEAGHYCARNVAGWLGLGTRNLVRVPTNSISEIDLHQLERSSREALGAGKRIAAFIATMGTTDTFGLDDLEGIVALRDRLVRDFELPYRPHIHADAVIGWAWSVFNDYDFEGNRLGFRPRTLRALAGAWRRLRHLGIADSVGVDFHKTGFAPYISSLFLLRDAKDLHLLQRSAEEMPYLYHFGVHRPGMFTLETSRSAGGVLAALANLKLFGQEGFQALLGHAVEMTQTLREHLEGHSSITVLNRDNFGPVTLFRVYPESVDTFAIQHQEKEDPGCQDLLAAHNDYNRRIFQYVHDEALAGRGVLISFTDSYAHSVGGIPIAALKSVILSPFTDERNVQTVVEKVLEAKRQVQPGAGNLGAA